MRPAFFVPCLLLAAAGAVFAGDIEWVKDFGQAQQLAKQTGRPMVLLFGVNTNGASC